MNLLEFFPSAQYQFVFTAVKDDRLTTRIPDRFSDESPVQ